MRIYLASRRLAPCKRRPAGLGWISSSTLTILIATVHQDRRWPPHPARRHRELGRRPDTCRSWNCRRCPPSSTRPCGTTSPLNGVLVPILVDGDGPVRRIIDGNHRKRIADGLGYDCPEVVKDGLSDQEKRTLARALNLARRQLDQAGKRAIIADQLRETPGRSNNWVGKQFGVDDKTVASVRAALQATSEIPKLERTLGADGKCRPASRPPGRDGEPPMPMTPSTGAPRRPAPNPVASPPRGAAPTAPPLRREGSPADIGRPPVSAASSTT